MENEYLNILENLCSLNGKLEAIIESSMNGIAELDINGNIVEWNPSLKTILKIGHKDIRGYSIYDFLPEEMIFSRESLPVIHGAQNIFYKDIMFDSLIKKGDKHFIELKLVPIIISEKKNFILIVKDKSDILTALHNREKFISNLLDLIDDIKLDNKETIYHLASLVELRDGDTGKHLERVEEFTRILATEYFLTYGHRDKWVTLSYVEDMAISAVLHDIGKVAISDSILLKPDQLTNLEMDAMKQHTYIAGKALEKYKGKKDFLAMGREIALTHHEKWNGKGYPRQLSGKEIPLSGRIVAICDTYDAITNKRPYKIAMEHETACKIISSERGQAFDPEIVDVFMKVHGQFKKVNQENAVIRS